jgi:CDP-diacylglycerol---serine O-phosphatidyltransferase
MRLNHKKNSFLCPVKKHIPNFITCLNLVCGCLAIVSVFHKALDMAAYLVALAAVFDFLDGAVARLLHVKSEIGKQLDSLADMVTFGVVPGFILYQMITTSIFETFGMLANSDWKWNLAFIALLVPVFSALRLAKFNIDVRQSESFIGVPTPANTILIASLPLILIFEPSSFLAVYLHNLYVLIALTVVCSLLLVSEIPLFSLKFKNFGWSDNKIRFLFLILALMLLLFFKYSGLPLVIFLYVALSLAKKLSNK